MYERLPLDYIGLTDGFGARKDPITKESSYHYGIDLGWHSYLGEPIYAIYDSKVIYEGTDENLGNYIVLSYNKNNNTIIYRFLHLKQRSNFKKGSAVKRGQIVGYMGATGYTTGVHLHFEYWICPKGYSYSSSNRAVYAKNPLNYCYLFENQKTSSDSANLVKRIVGESIKVEKNKNKNQLEVVKSLLRCRNNPSLSGNILGYIDYGVYNILDEKENDNYTWYRVGDNKWIADVDNSFNIYKISDEEKENSTNIIDNYKSFTASKDGYYYIKLKEKEIIYYP